MKRTCLPFVFGVAQNRHGMMCLYVQPVKEKVGSGILQSPSVGSVGRVETSGWR